MASEPHEPDWYEDATWWALSTAPSTGVAQSSSLPEDAVPVPSPWSRALGHGDAGFTFPTTVDVPARADIFGSLRSPDGRLSGWDQFTTVRTMGATEVTKHGVDAATGAVVRYTEMAVDPQTLPFWLRHMLPPIVFHQKNRWFLTPDAEGDYVSQSTLTVPNLEKLGHVITLSWEVRFGPFEDPERAPVVTKGTSAVAAKVHPDAAAKLLNQPNGRGGEGGAWCQQRGKTTVSVRIKGVSKGITSKIEKWIGGAGQNLWDDLPALVAEYFVIGSSGDWQRREEESSRADPERDLEQLHREATRLANDNRAAFPLKSGRSGRKEWTEKDGSKRYNTLGTPGWREDRRRRRERVAGEGGGGGGGGGILGARAVGAPLRDGESKQQQQGCGENKGSEGVGGGVSHTAPAPTTTTVNRTTSRTVMGLGSFLRAPVPTREEKPEKRRKGRLFTGARNLLRRFGKAKRREEEFAYNGPKSIPRTQATACMGGNPSATSEGENTRTFAERNAVVRHHSPALQVAPAAEPKPRSRPRERARLLSTAPPSLLWSLLRGLCVFCLCFGLSLWLSARGREQFAPSAR